MNWVGNRKPQSPWRRGWRARSDSKAASTMTMKTPEEPSGLGVWKPWGPLPWAEYAVGIFWSWGPQKPLYSPLYCHLPGRILSHCAGELAASLWGFWENLAGRKVLKPAWQTRSHLWGERVTDTKLAARSMFPYDVLHLKKSPYSKKKTFFWKISVTST